MTLISVQQPLRAALQNVQDAPVQAAVSAFLSRPWTILDAAVEISLCTGMVLNDALVVRLEQTTNGVRR